MAFLLWLYAVERMVNHQQTAALRVNNSLTLCMLWALPVFTDVT